MFGGMLMRLAPLLHLSLWGSDWGEYYHLSQELVSGGAHAGTNLGWGRAYVDFPGLFDLTGATALVTGIPVSGVMTFVVPCVTAISCLLVATIVLRLGGGPWAALVSAAVLAVMFPEVFTNSHPVPGPIGSVLMLGALLVFIVGDVWGREEEVDRERPMALYVLLLTLLLALMVTHHMSHLFLIMVLGMAYLMRKALVMGREPERDWWGVWSMVAALALATGYWLGVAETFRREVMDDLAGLPGYLMMVLAWVALLLLLAVGTWLGRRRTRVPALSMWGRRELGGSLMVYLIAGFALLVLVATFGFPGTDIEPGVELLLYVMPTVLVFALMVGSTEVLLRRHGGHTVVAWAAALSGSFLLNVAFQGRVLVPYRHVPYIVEAMAVMVGIGAIHLAFMLRPESTPREGPARRTYLAPLVVLVVALLVSMAITAYPPKSVMGNFQEGTTGPELGAVLWLRGGLPAPGAHPGDVSSGTVVTDHRLSSMAFGIGGQMATWDTGGPVLHGMRDEALWKALDDMDTPNGDRPVTAVVLSEDLGTGAALSQFTSPQPVDGEAWDKFFVPPFYTVYDGGDVWVMVVMRPLDATGEP
jgi:hypothetical protein